MGSISAILAGMSFRGISAAFPRVCAGSRHMVGVPLSAILAVLALSATTFAGLEDDIESALCVLSPPAGPPLIEYMAGVDTPAPELSKGPAKEDQAGGWLSSFAMEGAGHLSEVRAPAASTRRVHLALADASSGEPSKGTTKDWGAGVTLYGWLASFGVEAGGQELNRGPEDFISKANGALMVRGTVEWRRWTFLVDYIYADLRDTKSLDLAGATLKAKLRQDVVDVRFGYIVLDTRPSRGEPGTVLIAELGGRYWDTRANLELRVPPLLPGGTERVTQTSIRSSWWDPLAGVRARWIYTPAVAFLLQANVGGFGIGNSSDYTWEIGFYTSFRATKVLVVEVGYRFLQYSRGDSNVTMSGPLVGISFVF